jgi:tetratricopeptide (TPR) repeat protein
MPMYALIAEHWMYMPTIGLFLGAAQTVAVWVDARKSRTVSAIVVGIVALAALSLGIKTYLQNKIWHDSVSLFEHAIQCGSDSGAAHNILGRFYFKQEEYEKAAEHFRAEIAHPAPLAISLTSSAHMRLAFIYLGVRPDEGGVISPEEVARALPLTPHLPEATEELEKVLEVAPPDDPDAAWATKLLSTIRAYNIMSGSNL